MGERGQREKLKKKNNPNFGGSFLPSDLYLIVDKMILPLNTRKLHPASQSKDSITPNRSLDFPPRQIWNSICVML